MCQSNGYIKLYRSLKTNILMDKCDYRSVWLELLFDTEWKDGDDFGTARISQQDYAKKFGIPADTVGRILRIFRKHGMIEFNTIKSNSKYFTIVNILNWVEYQKTEKITKKREKPEQAPNRQAQAPNRQGIGTEQAGCFCNPLENIEDTATEKQAKQAPNRQGIGTEQAPNRQVSSLYINKKEEYKNEEISKKSSYPELKIPNDEIEILESDIPLQKRKKAEPSEEGKKFAEAFLTLLPENHKHTENDLKNWARDYDRLIAIDKLEKKEIWEMCKWARADSFWQSNFLSPCKLRNKNKDGVIYYQVFRTKIEIEKNAKNRPNNTNASGLRTGFKRDTDVDELRDAIRESILNGSGNDNNMPKGGYVTG